MTAFVHGLVLGKFLPPHAGHHHLVRRAACSCARVSVVVLGGRAEPLTVEARVAWLRATHADEPRVRVVGGVDEVPVNYDDVPTWDAHLRLVEAALARAAVLEGSAEAAMVDAVFTSEAYGDELARRLGARHVCVDPERLRFPVSGTAVRDDLVGAWEHLDAPARAGLARRVVFVGAESTGTTSVSREVARRLVARGGVWAATGWVPEYGRAYSAGRLQAAAALARHLGRPAPSIDDLGWTPDDFVAIARRQRELEDAAAGTGSPVLIFDTDAFATTIWHERYLGEANREVEALADSRTHPLYLLTDHAGVPFVQDGLRDGEAIRAWMTGRFVERLEQTSRRWVRLDGPETERVARAIEHIDHLVGEGWTGPP